MKALSFDEYRNYLVTKRGRYRRLFDTALGQMVLADLRKSCKIGQDIMVPGDPHATAYNAGQQRVYLRIDSILNWDHEKIEQLGRLAKENE